MANLWQIIQPTLKDATNLITNPSGETGTGPTGFAAQAGTITRDATQQRRGTYAIKNTPTNAVNDGHFWTTGTLTSGHIYVFSVDFYGTLSIPYQITFATTAGAAKGTPATLTGGGYWNASRVAAAWTADASNAFRLYAEKNNSADTTAFWTDGWSLIDCTAIGITQAQGLAMTYFDGDSAGAYWTGTSHASTSVLRGNSREGGVMMNFDTDLNTYVTDQSGVGAPPLTNVIVPYGLADGGLFQRVRMLSRTILLKSNWRGTTGNTQSLHLLRKPFLDAVKADLVSPQAPFWMRYTAPLKPQWIKAVYDAGAELTVTKADALKEQATLRFLAPDPLFYEEGNAGTSSVINQTVTNANRILMRSSTGVWSAMGTGGASGSVIGIAAAPDGTIYVTGSFTGMNSVANTPGIAQWNGTTFVALGTGLQGLGSGFALVFAADGTLYASGTFTTAGGVANTVNIGKWNGSVWSALGTGSNGTVGSLCIGNDGTLYAGGAFALMGGVANTVGIASWNGSVWAALGTGVAGGNATVYAAVIGADGNLYIAGDFTTANGVTVNNVAKWSGTTFVSLGGGMTGGTHVVESLAVGPDGALYAGGSFTTAGGVACANVAKWNGSAWSPLGSGVSGGAPPVGQSGLSWVSNLLYISGFLTSGGGLTPPTSLIIWNGSTYIIPDVVLPGTPQVFKAIIDPSGNFYIGFSGGGSATVPGNPTFTNNGTAIAHPTFVFTGPGTLQQVKNYTTGDTISFNLTLLAGETATLNLNPGSISFVSSFRGNLLGTILPASALFTFKLMPGTNNVSVLISGTTTAATGWTATWRIANLSADGGAS